MDARPQRDANALSDRYAGADLDAATHRDLVAYAGCDGYSAADGNGRACHHTIAYPGGNFYPWTVSFG